MALSIRTQIVKDLAAALRNISVANGHSFNCREVYELMPNEATLDSQTAQPCIFIWGGVEEENLNTWVDGVQSELDIHLVISGQTCYSAAEVGAEMAADVKQVLLSGTPWSIGGASVDLVPYQTMVAVSEVDEFQPGAYVQFVARFSTVLGNPREAYVKS
jgi:hypothetical protein